jgi:hypothetical protein
VAGCFVNTLIEKTGCFVNTLLLKKRFCLFITVPQVLWPFPFSAVFPLQNQGCVLSVSAALSYRTAFADPK